MAGASAQGLRIASIVGARPQFVKLSPVSRAMQRSADPIDDRIVHTGQHYDDAMSRVFFDELAIPAPAINLGIGSGPQGRQTARMLEAVEGYLLEHRPDAVIVYGDTNSTLAAALAAVKLHLPVAHVEAGLRSFNRRMAEELNRIATDHVADLLLAPTGTAVSNLEAEGLAGRTRLTGDVMYDAVLHYAEVAAARSAALRTLEVEPGGYGLATIHRAENTGPQELGRLLRALDTAASAFGRIIFPMHPRTSAAIRRDLPAWRPARTLTVVDPLGYLDMLALLQGASWVATDSGGLQKEAFFLNCPCITLRDETEWTETLAGGANFIAGSDGARLGERLAALAGAGVRRFGPPARGEAGPFGDGHAAERVVAAVRELCGSRL